MTPIPFQPAAAQGNQPPAPPSMPATDPRWTFAASATTLASPMYGLTEEQRERLTCWAVRTGFAPIHAAAILTIAEQAALRGGLDANAMYQLESIPRPAPPQRRNLWPALIAINAALIAIAGVLIVSRFS